jgi:hypothetical protein
MRAISLARLQHSTGGFRVCLIKMSEGLDRCGTVGQLGSHSQKDLKKKSCCCFLVPAPSDSGESASIRHLLDWALQMQSISQLVKLVAALGFHSKGCISAEALAGRSLVSRQKDRGVTAGIDISPIPRQRNSAPEPLPESHGPCGAGSQREIFIFVPSYRGPEGDSRGLRLGFLVGRGRDGPPGAPTRQ